MYLVNTDSDPWILEYDSCEKLYRDIMEHLNARNSEKFNSQLYDSLSAKIRIKMKQFVSEVLELNRKLNSANIHSALTPEEKERRKRQVETLLSKEVQLEDIFNQRKFNDNSGSKYNQSRAELFEKKKKIGVADTGTISWREDGEPLCENDGLRTVVDVKEENERLLKEQNESLEKLLNIVVGQKQIAASINNEVEHHNEILVDIADNMERVDGRINQANDMVTVIGRKGNLWGYWLVAFILFIAILGVAFA